MESLLNDSLLNPAVQEEVEKVAETLENENTLLSQEIGDPKDTTNVLTDLVEVDYDNEVKEQKRLIEEHNKRIYNSAEYKAEIVFNNIMQSAQRILSGPEKRKLKRECLRNAKAGKYDYMFDPEKIKKREERLRAKFEAVNKGDSSITPINTEFHTVDELSPEVIEDLKKMATTEKPE